MINLINVAKYNENNDNTILQPACALAEFLIGIKKPA